ncbi:hypothetical protein [Rodentibacter caecimuris]|uniref:hypothetical protein n=1 Tax=Rodentibacter caecimuris TaxID=1796644 RepID=UPI001F306E68|nr:hypothetical protein [Rodentibacter heylii]
MVPLADVEKQSIKDKQNPKQTKTYYNVQPYLSQQVEHGKDKDSGIYVDDSHLSHGLLFPGVNSYQDQTDEISLFKYKIADYLDPKSPHSMEEKETLAPVFKDILKELDLAKEEQGSRFEAGKLKGLLLNPVEQRRLTGIIVRHKSEWARSQSSKFNELIALARKLNDNDAADRIQKRVNDLVIDLKAAGFDSERKAYYLHPLGVIGWLAASVGDFDWFETPLVKLILSKESKGSFNAYIITNKNGKPRESHFTPTAQYHIVKMTIADIRAAQKNRIGPEGLHLFAVGIVQIIPTTLEQFLSWLKKYKSINREAQLFDEEFQRLMPMFFWEEKVSKVSSFFRGKIGVDKAAYAISREWASAGVPKGEPTERGDISDGGLITYYDAKPGNKAHYSSDVTIKALHDTKKMIDEAGGYDVVREISLSKIRG